MDTKHQQVQAELSQGTHVSDLTPEEIRRLEEVRREAEPQATPEHDDDVDVGQSKDEGTTNDYGPAFGDGYANGAWVPAKDPGEK